VSANDGAFHKRIVWSTATLASVRPSGENASDETMESCALRRMLK
jgi:hypothetical protein